MTSDAETTNSDWAIAAFEAAARAMYVHRSWKKAISDSNSLHKDKSHYEVIAGGDWDAGLVNRSQYIELRELAAAAVLASLPNVVAEMNAGTNINRSDEVWEKIVASR